MEGGRDGEEVVGVHEDDVGGFDGDVGAGGEGDADVGGREGGGVVDAVANHRYYAVGREGP